MVKVLPNFVLMRHDETWYVKREANIITKSHLVELVQVRQLSGHSLIGQALSFNAVVLKNIQSA